MNDAADAGTQQELVVPHVRRVGEHLDVVHDRFVDRRPVDVFAQLDPAASLKIPGVHPDLEDLNALGRLGPDGVPRFLGCGRLVEPVARAPPSGVVREVRVGAPAWRAEPGLGNVASTADLSELLIERNRQAIDSTVRRGRDDRAHAVVGVAVQVIDQVLAREVLRAPARVPLPSEMRVGVHDGGHDRLAATSIDDSAGRRGDRPVPPDLHQQPVLNDERAVVDHPSVSDDDACALKQQGTTIVLRRRRLAADRRPGGETEREKKARDACQDVHGQSVT